MIKKLFTIFILVCFALNSKSQTSSLVYIGANDRLFIHTELRSTLKLSLYNVLGEEVHVRTFDNGFAEADISFLKHGVYLYRISASNGSLVQSGKILIND